MDCAIATRILAWPPSKTAGDTAMDLIAEEPLSIRVQGRPYVVVMRTPGQERAHAAGLCLAEGLVRARSDIVAIGVCDGTETNTVTVTLQGDCAQRLERLGERRAYISQTGCGLCGKELIRDLHTEVTPLPDQWELPAATVQAALSELPRHQPLRARTRAAHAAALFDMGGRMLAAAEDVGRHNALDKAIGHLFLDERLAEAAMVILSSRISYELVQKAASARIPIIAAMSRPTALAVHLAESLNMSLVTRRPDDGIWVYTGANRLQMA